MRKKIVILTTSMISRPVGGFKVAFEYANRLAADGHEVTLVYSAVGKGENLRFRDYVRAIEPYFRYVCRRKPGWFRFHPAVKHKPVVAMTSLFLPKADIYVATARETSEALAQISSVPASSKFYLIQGYESWNTTEEHLFETWRYDMTKIVISPWLQECLKKQSVDSVLIPNGLDFDAFHLTVPIAEKKRHQVIMLYHYAKLKGSVDGIEAMKRVRQKFPDLKLVLFGTPAAPSGLPDWAEYHRTPPQQELCRLYNESAVYLGTSYSEGMSLTLCEAMQCGCAVVCTDIGGYRFVPEPVALMSAPGDVEAMAENVCRMLADDGLRQRLAAEANRAIQRFTWENAYSKFRETLGLEKVES